jgi:hypothetical protein
MLKILERATIYTTVSSKAYVAAGGELRGKKRVGLKPLLPTPTIISFHEVIAHDLKKERDNEKWASA